MPATRSTSGSQAGDVRLSMGGEPTFVAVDDMEGAGVEHRRRRPDQAAATPKTSSAACAKRFAPGGLLHYGQGKWYPGEQLPRWAFALYWRADGEPLWENRRPHRARGPPPTTPRSERRSSFIGSSARSSGLARRQCHRRPMRTPATSLLVEQKLPIGVDAATNKLEIPAERARLVRVFDRGLACASAATCCRPGLADAGPRPALGDGAVGACGATSSFCMPGDSPVGFRLPLGSLPCRPPIDYPHVVAADPLTQRAAVADRETLLQQRRTVTLESADQPPLRVTDEICGLGAHRARRSSRAMATLCVFMPPLADAEDYAALVGRDRRNRRATGQTRCTSKATRRRYDPRLNVIKVTPDPGRHRGQHPAGDADGTSAVDDHHRRSTKKRVCRGSAPKSSCSMAATPAPAAATTSCSAA